MKFSTIVLAAAASVSAKEVFQIQNQSGGCHPHSVMCSFQFDVYEIGNTNGAGDSTVHCEASKQSNGVYGMPSISDASCANAEFKFDLAVVSDGWNFSVKKGGQVASRHIPLSEIRTSTEPNAQVPTYVGPTDYALSN